MSASNKDFETTLKTLEFIVEKLNKGETSLEESLKLYEEGIKLSKECSEVLENAKLKVISLSEAERMGEIND